MAASGGGGFDLDGIQVDLAIVRSRIETPGEAKRSKEELQEKIGSIQARILSATVDEGLADRAAGLLSQFEEINSTFHALLLSEKVEDEETNSISPPLEERAEVDDAQINVESLRKSCEMVERNLTAIQDKVETMEYELHTFAPYYERLHNLECALNTLSRSPIREISEHANTLRDFLFGIRDMMSDKYHRANRTGKYSE